MANFSLPTNKAASPQRTTAGQRWSEHPTPTGTTDRLAILGGCADCNKVGSHAPCHLVGTEARYGHARADGLPTAQHLRAEDMESLFFALWLLEYCLWGMVDDTTAWNAGAGGDNPSQADTYEITGTSGSTMTLYGANPKRRTASHYVPDPDYPSPGHMSPTMDIGATYAIREGARVEFLAKSALEGRLCPYVTKIHLPASDAATVSFDVEVSHPVTCAMEPKNAGDPPGDGKYYCKLRTYELYPEDWPNVQADVETQFSTRTLTWERAAVAAAEGVLDLVDNADGGTRVIIADMTPVGALTAMAAWIVYDNAPVRSLTQEELLAAVVTEQVVGGYTTTLDVSAFLAADTGGHIQTVTCVYRPEASGSGDPLLLQFAGSCANDQRVPGGSYCGAEGRRCMASAVASLADNYRPGGCWQPSCSHFCLGLTARASESYKPERNCRPAQDWRRGDLLSALWVACSWVLTQSAVGIASYRWSRPSPALNSLAQMFGSGCGDTVPGGIFATKVAGHLPLMGERTTTTDGTGTTQEVTHGAFTRQNEWTAGTTPTQGFLPAHVSGWMSRDGATGSALPLALAHLPPGRPGHCHLYDFGASGSGYHLGNRLVSNSEAFVTSCGLADPEDEDVSAPIRARFA